MTTEISRETQKLILEQRRIERELERLYQEVAVLERSIDDVRNAISLLSNMGGLKEFGGQSLFPIGGGIFVFGTISDKDEVLVGVGSNIYLTKKVGEALKLLNERLTLFTRAHDERLKAINELRRRYDQITVELAERQMRAKR